MHFEKCTRQLWIGEIHKERLFSRKTSLDGGKTKFGTYGQNLKDLVELRRRNYNNIKDE